MVEGEEEGCEVRGGRDSVWMDCRQKLCELGAAVDGGVLGDVWSCGDEDGVDVGGREDGVGGRGG